MEPKANILVLGVGNLLLQDEGAGVRALEVFARTYTVPDGVELLDGGTSGLDLLHHIEGRDCLVILDVVKSGKPAGTLVRLEAEQVPALLDRKISPHQLGLSDLLAIARLTDTMPEKLVLLGVEPKSFDTGLEMSEEVGGCLEGLAAMLAGELGALGVEVQKLPE
ncbi:HyaD/HybD family hydrogenase maturation endopeptidase [Geobacter sp. SVR]|uniref:HyaD/HybD family hydrogenase maturation endopeptidase n=1 Tax=Geobacter sp. SVR TaxID=2495594 RepID=UPI00143EFBA4|nr:HyaD/HybD family hydrogenase maturation endopeptidase [Geobacter sp. SVR]BCS52170.1 membrane protein [Geobacter sp. SVR]GCF86625.1 membrane protein [Geobacter sp. SVR]